MTDLPYNSFGGAACKVCGSVSPNRRATAVLNILYSVARAIARTLENMVWPGAKHITTKAGGYPWTRLLTSVNVSFGSIGRHRDLFDHLVGALLEL